MPPFSHLLLILLITLPPLLLGATRPLPILFLAVLCAGSALYTTYKTSDSSLKVSYFGAFCILILSWGCIQLLPLPTTFTSLLSPLHSTHLPAVNTLIPTPITTSTLSLNPANTALALLRWAALACAALTLSTLLSNPKLSKIHTPNLATTSATTFAIMGVLQVCIGLTQTFFLPPGHILGLFPTSNPTLGLISGTFINSNHAGTFLAMSALASAGLALEQLTKTSLRQPYTLLALGATLLLSGAAVINASRSSVLGLAVATAALLIHFNIQKENKNPNKKRATTIFSGAMMASALIAGLGVFFTGWHTRVAWELGQDSSLTSLFNADKTKIILGALSSTPQAPWTGIGLDAFGSVASTLLKDPLPLRMSFVESDFIEMILTTGIPFSILLLALFSIGTYKTLRSSLQASPTQLGILYALLAFIVSAWASFNLFTLGLTLPALALVSTLHATSTTTSHSKTLSKRPAFGLLLVIAALIPSSFALYTHHNTHQSQPVQLLKGHTPPTLPTLDQTLFEALRRTPTDAHTHAQLSLLYLNHAHAHPNIETSLKRSLSLSRRASTLSPSNTLAALTYARTSALSGDLETSADAFRTLLTHTRPFPKALIPELLKTLPNSMLRARALPDDPYTLRAFALWMRTAKAHSVLLPIAIDMQSIHNASPHASLFAIQAAVDDSNPALATLYGEQAIAEHPTHVKIFITTARAYNSTKEHLAALRVLQQGLVHHPNHPSLHLDHLATLLTLPTSQQPPDLQTLLSKSLSSLRAHTHTNPALYAQTLCMSARVALRNKHNARATRERDRANALKPNLCKLSIPSP